MKTIKRIIISAATVIALTLTACSSPEAVNLNTVNETIKINNVVPKNDKETTTVEQSIKDNDLFDGYTYIEVDGGDLSGHREPNVVVDVGFGEREYYAFTNQYAQVDKLVAKKVILQDENTEPVNSKGRYYDQQADVPGVESATLDRGHILADSLGGEACSYNITPQDSVVNRKTDMPEIENQIREAGGCTDMLVIITYPNSETQIPSTYSYEYKIDGQTYKKVFTNGKDNETKPQKAESTNEHSKNGSVIITEVEKVKEFITLINNSNQDINLDGWKIRSVKGDQTYTFNNYILTPGDSVTVGDSNRTTVDLHWLEGKGIWNNTKQDKAELYNADGLIEDSYVD